MCAMIAAETVAGSSFNWYDVVVGLVLVYGIWNGVRLGLFGEILRVVGMVLMVVAALQFYIPAGNWLKDATKMSEEPAKLLAFVVIAVAVYLVTLAVRNFITARVKKVTFLALIDNLGGAVAGLVRMVVLMAFLTIAISLMRSPFWHRQVSTNSVFGATVVAQFPSVAKVVKKSFPESLWFAEQLKRRDDPDIDNSGTKTSPR